MQNAKDTARQLIDQLPDSASLNDIMYELYVNQKIELGMQDSREGKITPTYATCVVPVIPASL